MNLQEVAGALYDGEGLVQMTVYLTGTYEILMPCDVCDCEEYRWSGLRDA